MKRECCICSDTNIKDYGGEPFIANIDALSKANPNFRTALWTGEHLQLTLMSIPVGGDIGLEMHSNLDQFIRIEDGTAYVMMGHDKNAFDYQMRATDNYAVIIPSGTWHNIINTGNTPLKLCSVYAPVQHRFGTVHRTQADAQH